MNFSNYYTMWSNLSIFNLEFYLPLFLGATLLIKTMFFMMNKTQNWRFADFFYFNQNHIKGSRNTKTLTAKKIQNILSQVALTMSLLTIIQIAVKALVANY